MNAMAVHYDLNFGVCMHGMSGEVAVEWVVTADVLITCEPTSSPDYLIAIERSLTQGCPIDFTLEEMSINKEMLVCHGNHPNVTINCPITMKTLNKEERNSHVM